MSRIYLVTDRLTGKVSRYVRANTLNGAVRAHAAEIYEASQASTEDVYQAMKAGYDILDAVAPEQVDLMDTPEPADPNDPGPVPEAA